jgi:hypothetical protein
LRRGRGKAWYARIYGHLLARHIRRLRDSFNVSADAPETDV